MFLVKINDVFLPTTISENGFLLDTMTPQYMGFRIEIIDTTDSASFYANTLVGVELILIEKATRDNATFYKGDTFAVADDYVPQELCEEWTQSTRVILNNSDRTIMRFVSREE